jgi:hypothetical protein
MIGAIPAPLPLPVSVEVSVQATIPPFAAKSVSTGSPQTLAA